MSYSNYKDIRYIPLDDGPANNHDLPTTPVGKQDDAATVPPADVALSECAAAAGRVAGAGVAVGGAAAGRCAASAGVRRC